VDYYSALKMKGILPLGEIMLCGTNLDEKTNTIGFHSYEVL
jgi:hypothetical protein